MSRGKHFRKRRYSVSKFAAGGTLPILLFTVGSGTSYASSTQTPLKAHATERRVPLKVRVPLSVPPVKPVTKSPPSAVRLRTSGGSSHTPYAPPEVAVILVRVGTLGEAQAAQARAITEGNLPAAQVERISAAEYDVVISPLSGYKAARVVQTAVKDKFLHVTIEDAKRLAAGTIIPGVQSADIAGAPGAAASSTPAADPAVPATYTVTSGDSLWTIAGSLLGNPDMWTQLASENHLADPDRIFSGQVLYVEV